jgi:hypothetical protein
MAREDEESGEFDWTTGGEMGIEHRKILGYGGSGQVHEVVFLLKLD